jgi:predicted transcriptional regulator
MRTIKRHRPKPSKPKDSRVKVDISPTLKAQVARYASLTRRSEAQVVRDALEAFVPNRLAETLASAA